MLVIIVHGLLERRRDLSHALLVACKTDCLAVVLRGVGEGSCGEDANIACGDPLHLLIAKVVLERCEEDAGWEAGLPVL